MSLDPDLIQGLVPGGLEWLSKSRIDGLNDVTREAFDPEPAEMDWNGPRGGIISLPTWLHDEICALAGIHPATDLSHATANNSFGWPMEIPRAEGRMGPDPVAWEAIKAVVLDPQTIIFAPEENSWDDGIDEFRNVPWSMAEKGPEAVRKFAEETPEDEAGWPWD